jgi:ATP-dependent RNA helicase DHX29
MFPPLGDESSKLRALDTLDAVENDMDEIDTDDPTQEYVRLKLLLDRLSLYRRGETIGDSEEAAQLRKRISAVQRDYLFDENDAEVQYREERKKVDAIALREKLTGAVASETSVEHVKLKKRSTIQVTVLEDQKSQSLDIFDGDDESSAGLLDVLQMSNTETTPEGITITLKDMALPKHWSGRTPKALLQDTVVKKDRYAAVTYSIVSGPSLAKRASVGVRWDGQRTETWTMSDVACRDERQAELYIATVALHALSFPPSDGFSSSSQTGPTFFRSLPPAYRDLWDELEDNRKEAENTKNRALWAKVRGIIEPKLDAESKASLKSDCICDWR